MNINGYVVVQIVCWFNQFSLDFSLSNIHYHNLKDRKLKWHQLLLNWFKNFEPQQLHDDDEWWQKGVFWSSHGMRFLGFFAKLAIFAKISFIVEDLSSSFSFYDFCSCTNLDISADTETLQQQFKNGQVYLELTKLWNLTNINRNQQQQFYKHDL